MKALANKMTVLGMSETAAAGAVRVMAIVVFAVLTALAAQVKLPLPGNVVPITLQTAIVLLAGMRLGSRDGALSQALYIACGALGLPFFAGASGALVLVGPTGGYLVGFVLAAYLVGKLPRASYVSAWLSAFAASLVVFVTGVAQLKWFMGYSWEQAVVMGVVPFLVGDLVKVTLAATTHRLLPKKSA